jgi:hypothetical protein
MTRVKRPVLALAELVWNSVDADATEVNVLFEENPLGALERIRVIDNGAGMEHATALEAFGSLGGSWKRRAARTGRGRLLHGRAGKGRFRAFSIGELIEWHTRYASNGTLFEYVIKGSLDQLGTFKAEDPTECDSGGSGTEVVLLNITRAFQTIRGTDGAQAIAEQFAIYLREYPEVTIVYDGITIRPSEVEKDVRLYPVPPHELDGGQAVTAELMIIEWKIPAERALFFCDAHGFTLERVAVGIHAPGFQFTAYLRSDYLRELDDEGLLSLDEMHPVLTALVASARSLMRDHFRARAATATRELVEEWKKERIYPYEGAPKSDVEKVERQMFEVVALNVHAYMPGFSEATSREKQFSMRLLRQAIEDNPVSVRTILSDVLELPLEKQDQLAQLLRKTSLSAIISSSKLVANRIDFLKGLEYLVFEPESKEVLLERRQLHKILEHETWIFGEQFNLTLSDQSLTEVLRRHLRILGREHEAVNASVHRENGSSGIVDLMLSRIIPMPRADQREHLVVELKRPSKKIDLEVLHQIQSYAFAVAEDERFRDTETTWVFWAMSNEMSNDARRSAHQSNRPEGLVFEDAQVRIQVWAKTWGQLLEDCRARLDFFQRSLEYTADDESALEYLRTVYAQYMPSALLDQES